ncbi:GNAT family N-acetyltransferase [Paraherbaspirillum soli]|uniref:GNAT family N-acetyltransferase n=1 Tax=Paraherbaspirillum soli TaxID=631222 RepID=A0ABW0M6D5_9BURK
MWNQIADVVLEDERVTLRRIDSADIAGYREIAFEEDIWRYFVVTVKDEAELQQFIDTGLADTAAGRRIVFSIIDKSSGAIAGSMSFGNLSEHDKRIEIGWSWLGQAYRGTGLNQSAKQLLLDFAFDQLQCERVEFKTDVLNLRAQKGLTNIGATKEGVLRSHTQMPGGRRRDTIYFSILRHEWPAIQDTLRQA